MADRRNKDESKDDFPEHRRTPRSSLWSNPKAMVHGAGFQAVYHA